MELPNPPWYRRWSYILAGVIVLAIGVAGVGLAGFRGVGGPGPTVTTLASTTTVTSTTAAPPTTTAQPKTTVPTDVLWSKTGSDVGKSPGFRAPSSWHIEWSFDCSNFKKFGAGNFKITGREAFERVQIQVVEVESSGSQTFNGGGYGWLLVDSVCKRWTVTVVAD
jgi:hypothetical protein